MCEKVIIYNPASIDSTITAAVMSNIMEAVIVPASANAFIDKYEEYIWLGVEPEKDTLKTLSKAVHIGYYLHNNLPKHITKGIEEIYTGPIPNEADVVIPVSLLGIALSRMAELDTAVHWQLSVAIHDFMTCKKVIPILDQAFVYDAYQRALTSINDGVPFVCKAVSQDDVLTYMTFISQIKARMGKVMYQTDIVIDAKRVHVPVMNCNGEAAPWVIKLASCAYDNVVTYEQHRDRTVYTVFSRTAGFDSYMEKFMHKDTDGNIRLSHKL